LQYISEKPKTSCQATVDVILLIKRIMGAIIKYLILFYPVHVFCSYSKHEM